jgi:molybdopterin-guanine dinucleotide biosynthesis protein A
MPLVRPALLLALAGAAQGIDAAIVQTGPLPGAYRRSTLPVLERRIAAGELALHRALAELEHCIVEADLDELKNVNTPADLA